MSELSVLTEQRDDILAKIREIETTCEGIENENNAKRAQELNLEQAQLTAKKNEMSANLSAVQSKLTAIGAEIAKLSGTGIDRILESIKKQRWYFFKNKTKVLMDRDTGILWANLNYYNIAKDENMNKYAYNADYSIIKDYHFDEYDKWSLPTKSEFIKMIDDKSFPFIGSSNRYIKNKKGNNANYFRILYASNSAINLNGGYLYKVTNHDSYWLPKTSTLVENSDYENNVSSNNSVYTEKERLQFTLDLFVQNELWPIFNDDEITQLYKKIYFEKPVLLEQLQDLQEQIESLQNVTLLSSEFDYTALLAKYDIKAIDSSIIKYYKAIQEWIDELVEKLNYYEQETNDTITEYNNISRCISQKYRNNLSLSDDENDVISERMRYFQKNFSLDINSVKNQLISFRKKADILEARIDDINESGEVLTGLAELEKLDRASFSFIAENTANIIKNTLLKIEYYEANKEFVSNAVTLCDNWTNDFIDYKKTICAEFTKACNEKNLSDETSSILINIWHTIRLEVEKTLVPLVDRSFRKEIPVYEKFNVNISEIIARMLDEYKKDIDNFFTNEILDKILYFTTVDDKENLKLEAYFGIMGKVIEITQKLQSVIQNNIFNCQNTDDRVYIFETIKPIFDVILTMLIDTMNSELFDETKEYRFNLIEIKNKNYSGYLSDNQSFTTERTNCNDRINNAITECISIVTDMENIET